MNETLKTILNRRSYRAYKPEPVKESDLQSILEAGKFAPSGMNSQPWHFSVIRSQALLNQINEAVKEGLAKSGNPQMAARAKDEKFSIFYHAPALIIVSADPKAATPQFDSAIAMSYMFLAASSLGVGSCWIQAISVALNDESQKSLRKTLAVPEGYTIYSAGAFGYPAVAIPAPAPRKEGTVSFVE